MSTIQDGSVDWQKDFIMGLRKLPLVVGYNKKETYTTSGSFTAPQTGLYKITLQGAGGGGAGASNNGYYGARGGAGGGSGANIRTYEKLIAGTTYSFTIGAGGLPGTNTNDAAGSGGNGGDTTITLNSVAYKAGGGYGGNTPAQSSRGGNGGIGYADSQIISRGFCGENGGTLPTTGSSSTYYVAKGGNGGGLGGSNADGSLGGGGGGANYNTYQSSYDNAHVGGDGYITFEWFDPSEAFPDIFANLDS